MEKDWIPLRLRNMNTGEAIENIHKLPLQLFIKECEQTLVFELEEIAGANGQRNEYFRSNHSNQI